jgi:hypothetical protein
MNIIFRSATIIVALAITACASQPKLELGFVPGSCKFKYTQDQAPDWVCAPAKLFPAGHWYQAAEGHSSLKDTNLQQTVAMQNARIELARRASVFVEETFNQTIHTDGTDQQEYTEIAREIISKVSTSLTLPATFKEAETFDEDGNLYVLVKVSEHELMQKLLEQENRMMREFNAELKRRNLPPVAAQSEEGEAALGG